MRAVCIKENRALTWEVVPDPIRREDDVIIQVHAAGLNRADLLQREGKYPSPPGWPDRMGLEVAGLIKKAPVNSPWKVGDKVCALLGGGGYAEQVAVPSDLVLQIPDGITMEEAAAIPEVYTTAYLNLFIEGDLKPNETVFVPAGASGLGIAIIQMAKHVGAKVITTVGSDEKVDFLTDLGVDMIINRKKADTVLMLKKNKIDLAIDCVAGPDLGEHLKSMNPGGRWIVIATLGGALSELDMTDFFKRGVRLIGSTLRNKSSQMKVEILRCLKYELWPKFRSREVQVVIHKILPIQAVEEAHSILFRNENIGKVVLTVPNQDNE